MPLLYRVVGAQPDLSGVVVRNLDRWVSHILWHINNNRPRPPRGGDIECLFDRLRQIPHILDQKTVFYAGARDADSVHLLKGIAANKRRGYLAGKDHQRDRVHKSGGDTCQRIGCTRARGDQRNTGLSGCAGIAIRCMESRLLMPHQNVLNLLLLEDCIIDMQHSSARVAKQILYALFFQALNQNFSTA